MAKVYKDKTLKKIYDDYIIKDITFKEFVDSRVLQAYGTTRVRSIKGIKAKIEKEIME